MSENTIDPDYTIDLPEDFDPDDLDGDCETNEDVEVAEEDN